MTKHTYRTIIKPLTGEFKEKSSRFLGFAFPVENEDQVKEVLAQHRKKFFDAHHICFAYCLGYKCEHKRAYDDGEPKHAAGDPILGQIRSRDLTNVLVVVVRYFGGTKLGISGLIAAYRSVAAIVLDNTESVLHKISIAMEVEYPYSETAVVMQLVNDFAIEIKHQSFEEKCGLKGLLPIENKELFSEQIKKLIISHPDISVLMV